jgi:hypothetical protein
MLELVFGMPAHDITQMDFRRSIALLVSADQHRWDQRGDGLYIHLPAEKPDEPAFAFRIEQSRNGKCAVENGINSERK